MEPYRPLNGQMVVHFVSKNCLKVDVETKNYLASLSTLDLRSYFGILPVSQKIQYFVLCVAESIETGKPKLVLPDIRFKGCKKIWLAIAIKFKRRMVMTAYLDRVTSGSGHFSEYRLMRILVTFDLPVETKKQRHEAAKFRQFPLDIGFEMSQFSNYLRFCNDKEHWNLCQENRIHFARTW